MLNNAGNIPIAKNLFGCDYLVVVRNKCVGTKLIPILCIAISNQLFTALTDNSPKNLCTALIPKVKCLIGRTLLKFNNEETDRINRKKKCNLNYFINRSVSFEFIFVERRDENCV